MELGLDVDTNVLNKKYKLCSGGFMYQATP